MIYNVTECTSQLRFAVITEIYAQVWIIPKGWKQNQAGRFLRNFPRHRVCIVNDIGVGAGIFLGVRKIFARIFQKLPKKFLGNCLCEYFLMTTVFGMTSNKKPSCDSEYVGRHFFQIKVRWAPFLLLLSGNLRRSSQIFVDIARLVTKSKLLGVPLHLLHPCLLHHWSMKSFNLSISHQTNLSKLSLK